MTPDVEARNTHISFLFLVGDEVYKANKAVDLGFLDHTTLEARRHACEREVTVNRRFAPDVYQGVATLIGPDGRPCEYLVVMRRMPDERRLTTLLAGPEGPDCLRDVARRVAVVHAVAPVSAEISAHGSVDAVRRNWRDNFDQMRTLTAVFTAPSLDAAQSTALRYLGGRGPLFEHRRRTGRVRDGHGDLLADDIFCLPDGPRLLDALAFRDDLRHGDVLLDAAFLAMDVERLGHPDLAQRYLGWYREFSADTFPDSLAHHYIAYRAQVRAKVSALRAAQGDPTATEAARALLAMCRRHLDSARVRLVLVGGLPATGKSTLSDRIARAAGWTVISNDEVRKELAGVAHDASLAEAPGSGRYTIGQRGAVYAETLRRAEQLLGLGETVIIDASWSAAEWRTEAATLAVRSSADLIELCCVTPAEVADNRLRSRSAGGPSVSDADLAVAGHLRATTDPWPTATMVDTFGALSSAVATALHHLMTPATNHQTGAP